MAYYRAVAHADAVPAAPERIGVLAVNLGTPDSPSYLAVQRYLREFLADRRVINTSRLIWLPLLYGVVLPLRPLKTRRKYRKIWMSGGSPLAVAFRLILLSILVGVVLAAIGFDPWNILHSIRVLFQRLWDLGFDAINWLWRYFLLGAVIVVPIWLLSRLFGTPRAR